MVEYFKEGGFTNNAKERRGKREKMKLGTKDHTT